MKPLLSLAFVFCVSFTCHAADLPLIRPSADGHYLVKPDGSPFFWLGDTAWQLFMANNRQSAETYLNKRREQGFTVIQAVALSEFKVHSADRGIGTNIHGHVAIVEGDPARPLVVEGGSFDQPNDYWDNVDGIIDLAAEKGLYVGLLPCWGLNYVSGGANRAKLIMFNVDNARTYGEWIGKRYADRKNIIWIIGGDDTPLRGETNVLAVYRAMVEGIAKGATGEAPKWNEKHPAWDRLLMTFHPSGAKQSSTWFHNDAWLDFNMTQTGHATYENRTSYTFIEADRRLQPFKPVVDGEPCYEDHPAWDQWKPVNRQQNDGTRFRDYEVRRAAYWSMLSGAAGHTYGHHAIWKFHETGDAASLFQDRTWQEAIDRPGANQMTHMRKFFEKYEFQSLGPDQSLIAGDAGADPGIRAARDAGGRWLLIYTPEGKAFETKLDGLKAAKLKSSWFDTRTGETTGPASFDKSPTRKFTPPEAGARMNDWVLVVEGGQ